MKKNKLINNVKRARERDAKAIEALYSATYSVMHSVIYNLCSNKNDVEDILQEGYVSAFANLNQLTNDEAFVSWLKKTMVNAWRMYLRNNVPDYDTTVFEVAEEQLESWQLGRSLQDTVEISETNREIWELVQVLPENQRVCMVLYYYEDMKVEEIAESLGIPEGSVKSRLYYGRLKLKESMEQRGIHFSSALTVPAAEAAASQTMLAKILAALEVASDSGTAAAGLSVAAKLALSVAALLTAGGIIGGVAFHLQSKPSGSATHREGTTEITATTATASTVATTTATTTTLPATTAPKLYVSFDYQKADGGVILTNYKGNEPNVVIPDTLDGMNVVAIGQNAFKYSRVLQSVTIPPTVRAIGSGAFRECRHLRRVSIGSGVNVIGDAAFLGCALETVSIPSNVREIESYAFAYCPSLTEVTVEEGTERISYAAFRDCPNLRAVTLPSSVNIIGGDAFDGAASDFSITAPEGSYAYEYELRIE
ncbi:MAG: sigma-70 family RNA polymerase sigma factor [Clostridia bacterium]|nr:sigma-70 family RNA polymerase sigma factor [Clostridia bacterium]